MIVGSKVKAAAGSFEVRQHHFHQFTGKLQLAGIEAYAGQLQQRLGQKHVVVEVGVESGVAVGAGGQQPPVTPMVAAQKLQRGASRGGQISARQSARSARQRANRQRIPAGENFIIARRAHPGCTHGQ